MRKLSASAFVACVVLPCVVVAQVPSQVQYCQALVASYRKAVADGQEPRAGVGEAIANCPTNPPGSIVVLERTLKDMKVSLPSR
jgi:hypothetical protein